MKHFEASGPVVPEVVNRTSGLLLAFLAVLTCGTGVYLLALRPAMLPEDIRYTKLNPQEMSAEALEWVQIVFRTWGGFVLGFGIFMMAVAVYIVTGRRISLQWGVPAAVLVSFGRFLASNVRLQSEFLWFIATLFVLSVVTALSFVLSAPTLRNRATEAATTRK